PNASRASSPGSAARARCASRTWRRCCARSGSRSSRPTSTSSSSSPCWPASASGPSARGSTRRSTRPSRSSSSSTRRWSRRWAGSPAGSSPPPARRRACSWPACRAPARRRPRRSSPAGSASRAATRSSSVPTSSGRPPSSSCGRWASASASRSSAGRVTPSRAPGPAAQRPRAAAGEAVASPPPDATAPDYTFLVADAMTGQDAVTVAESFDEALALDAVVLTKLDGDARGGAALSVKEVVGKPIAFASTGEKVEDFDLFHPDRLASRILGMGDVLTLIEKAEQVYEKEEAEKAATRLLEGRFTLEDFLEQLQQVRKMGPLQNLMGMLPGLPKEMRNAQIDEAQINRVEAIIRSM